MDRPAALGWHAKPQAMSIIDHDRLRLSVDFIDLQPTY